MENKKYKKILVVGIGNADYTIDAFGPCVAENLKRIPNLPAVVMGGIGNRRLATQDELLSFRNIINIVKPDYVIAVDNAMGYNPERMNKVIYRDFGVTPGAAFGEAGTKGDVIGNESLVLPVEISTPLVQYKFSKMKTPNFEACVDEATQYILNRINEIAEL